MRRHAVTEGFKEVSEFLLGVFSGNPEDIKHMRLQGIVVNSDGASSELSAVQHNVIRFCADSAGITVKIRKVFIHRSRKGMVHRRKASLFLAPLQQRELGNPQKAEIGRIEKTEPFGTLTAQRAEGINDNLPDPESLADVWADMPELSPPLIDGVLRQGHKMLLAGPSKAGKSYALIELCIAIAEGKKWIRWQCAKGRILYVNLELDRPSCLHRFKDVYHALDWEPRNVRNIDIWNLRGNSIPMDKLAPKLVRRAAKKGYIAVVIDPIYKVITGDENSADQMAHFCNQFDKVCHELQCAVIYCHHHSKGLQGAKRSMDRASGSGVFARDPDAILDYIELEVTDEVREEQENEAVCSVCRSWLDRYKKTEEVSQDDLVVGTAAVNACIQVFGNGFYNSRIQPEIYEARQKARRKTAWRIDGTLREFEKFSPVSLWFDYPIHTAESDGVLQDLSEEGAEAFYRKGGKRTKEKKKSQSDRKKEKIINAINTCNFGEPPTVDQLCEAVSDMELKRDTIVRWIRKSGYHLEGSSRNNSHIIIKNE